MLSASRYGYINVINALIHAGADVNHNDFYGDSALIYGIRIVLKKIFILILTKLIFDLFKASRYGYINVVNALIHAGADVNQKDSYGNTAVILGIKIILINIFIFILTKLNFLSFLSK